VSLDTGALRLRGPAAFLALARRASLIVLIREVAGLEPAGLAYLLSISPHKLSSPAMCSMRFTLN
jgi:hypothetical protein